MKFDTHNDTDIDINGTSLRGYLNVSYDNLIKKLGEPSEFFDDYKTDASWSIYWNDGDKATIYNWKNGKNYCGSEGLDVKDIMLWNVGGLTGSDGVDRLQKLFCATPKFRKAG